MRVTILGTGYVGLTTGAALAYLGHDVSCVDKDESKIERLKQGEPPIYEPNLKELLDLSSGHLRFLTSYEDSVPEAEVIFIAVGTPPRADGSPDLRFVRAAADEVGRNLGKGYTVVVNKSTVPIGSGKWVRLVIEAAYFERHGRDADGLVGVGSNPEFLRESSAVADTLFPDRIVIGAEDERVRDRLVELYRPLIDQTFDPPSFLPRPQNVSPVALVLTDPASSEMIKYAANAFLALKISFINEIGSLAAKVGANIQTIAKGVGMDKRIGPRFLQAGLGWGGSCFGKDTSALLTTAFEHGVSMPIVRASREVNWRMRVQVIEKLLGVHGSLEGKRISLLGMAFKPETDDLRDAPVLDAGAPPARPRSEGDGPRPRGHRAIPDRTAGAERGNRQFARGAVRGRRRGGPGDRVEAVPRSRLGRIAVPHAHARPHRRPQRSGLERDGVGRLPLPAHPVRPRVLGQRVVGQAFSLRGAFSPAPGSTG